MTKTTEMRILRGIVGARLAQLAAQDAESQGKDAWALWVEWMVECRHLVQEEGFLTSSSALRCVEPC